MMNLKKNCIYLLQDRVLSWPVVDAIFSYSIKEWNFLDNPVDIF
jgi:hypothetical protein